VTDSDARRRIAEDLDATLVVEAAAGTGKTSALVGRIVAVLRAGRTTLDRVIAVTFTDKAAGELKLRLRTELERAGLATALAELEAARVGTIHSICADILREYPVEARVDPLFEIAAADEEGRLIDQAFDGWFQDILAAPPEGVRRLLRRRPRYAAGRLVRARELLRDAAGRVLQHRDFDGVWRRDPFDRAAAIDDAMQRLAELGAQDDPALAPLHRFLADVRRRETIAPRGAARARALVPRRARDRRQDADR
jgi:superfamily I DNA/RNA helicase